MYIREPIEYFRPTTRQGDYRLVMVQDNEGADLIDFSRYFTEPDYLPDMRAGKIEKRRMTAWFSGRSESQSGQGWTGPLGGADIPSDWIYTEYGISKEYFEVIGITFDAPSGSIHPTDIVSPGDSRVTVDRINLGGIMPWLYVPQTSRYLPAGDLRIWPGTRLTEFINLIRNNEKL